MLTSPLRRPESTGTHTRLVGVHTNRTAGAACGLLAAAAAVGVGEAAAAAVRPEASPVVVVANRFITLTPHWLTEFAIRQFGTHDKDVLRLGIYVVIAVFAAAVGVAAVRRLALGLAGVAVFGVVGVYCAVTAHAHRAGDVVPTVVATLAAAAVLVALVRTVTATPPAREDAETSRYGSGRTGRRQFLAGATATAGGAALAGFGGRAVQHQRFDAARSRAAVVLPAAATPAAPLPANADLGKSPVPYVTTNSAFYRIDTAIVVPQLSADTWTLKIHGMVDHPIELTYADLLARPLIERWITMMCVSYEIGSDLIGNALFRGALLADILRGAGIQAGADQLVSRSHDGMTIGTPVQTVMDGRDAMLAVGMNGAPLPIVHGFPVRMVVPGLYGYVSACKWIVDIEVTTFAAYDAYWVQQGWVAELPIVLGSRIDTPRTGSKVRVGQTVPIAGVAWHQHVGIGKVEVQIDGGPWTQATLGGVPSDDAWRQWYLPWTVPSPGTHKITVRATDSAGHLQDSRYVLPYPGAATGLHVIAVTAS